MFYAIVENGGKQYKTSEGQYLEIDLLHEEVGAKKKFDQVLLLVDEDRVDVGTPYLDGVQVEATIVNHFKGEKITVFKYRPKQRYRVKTGHRQKYSRLIVDAIVYPGMTKKEKVLDKAENENAATKILKEKPAEKKKQATVKRKSVKTVSTTAKKVTVKKSASKSDAVVAKNSGAKKPKKSS